MSEPKYTVGQTVHIRSMNRGSAGMGTVTKVGRTLVHVKGQYGNAEAFRIETGVRNDNYGHEWIQTEAEYAEATERSALEGRLGAAGLRLEYGSNPSIAKLRRLVEAAESE